MSYSLANSAVRDLHEIWMFIAKDNLTAADRLQERLVACCDMLGRQPLIGESREEIVPGLRSFPVGNYVVFHRVEGEEVRVLRILHGARDVESILRPAIE